MLSVAYYYSGAFERILSESQWENHVDPHDFVVTTGWGQYGLSQATQAQQDALEPRLYRYCDWWGASYYLAEQSSVDRWYPGPGDWGFIGVRTPKSPWLYRVDKFHALRHAYAVTELRDRFPDQAGVFMDDFSPDKGYWQVPSELREKAWPLYGTPGWADELLEQTEGFCRPLLGARSQTLLVNGEGRSHSGPRLWESVGKWLSLDDLLEAQPGDHVLVKGIDTDRQSWLTTTRPEGGFLPGTSFLEVFRLVRDFCLERELYLGLCLEDAPGLGESSATSHLYSDPRKWEAL